MKTIIIETHTPRNELDKAKEQVLIYLDRFRIEWVSERDSGPMNINHGKSLLNDFGGQLVGYSQLLRGKVEKEILDDIQFVITNTRKIQRQTLTLDGGVSFHKFWEDGDKNLTLIQSIIEKI